MNCSRLSNNILVQSVRRKLLSSGDLRISNRHSSATTHPSQDKTLFIVAPHIGSGPSLGENFAAEQVRMMASSTDQSSLASKKISNRLAFEKSPYLLQHATNPVDWYPWGPEAIEKAKRENKLIFLSVGYSTCHWCHVMEKESFENESVAKLMNEYFINIKVDREERPDIDKLYMSFIQASVGGGGWPMSVFLTPDLEPLAGGTYFPPEDRFGRPGFKTVLLNIANQWKTKNATIKDHGKYTLELLRKSFDQEMVSSQDIDVPCQEVWTKCLLQLIRSYDDDYGGFSTAPKFPQPSHLNFLFHMYSRNKNTQDGFECLSMALKTLKKMAYGGIHDHVNCGFARYSVDDRWHVPHFEKMLYDQAQLVVSYCDAYVLTKDEFYADIAKDILTYVSRDLSHELGGFYSAEDADSYPHEGASSKLEGAFCVWEYGEIRKLLSENLIDGKSYADIFCYHYTVKLGGNVDSHHRELENKNVLACFGSYEDTANKFTITIEDLKDVLKKCCAILYEERKKRPKPHVDSKIVTSWNGLMISGYAKSGFALKDQSYINRAILAATFIKKYLYNEEQKSLLRCCYKGEEGQVIHSLTPIHGFLDDYAFLIKGLLDLYEASLDTDWLQWAETLQEQQDRRFWDTKGSGYFTSPEGDSTILIRSKEDQDGAEPCGNSVSVQNLIRLAVYLDRQDLRAKAGRTLTSFSDRLKTIPMALSEMTSGLLLYNYAPTQVFIAGTTEDNNTQALLDVVRATYIPGRILAIADGPGGRAGLLYRRHESLAKLKTIHGKSAAYVCRNFACSLPVTEPEQLAHSLDSNDEMGQ